MHPLTAARARGNALTRQTLVALTLCALAWLSCLPAGTGVAQNRSPSPDAGELWKKYPLAPTAAPSATVAQPTATPSPAASRTDRPPARADRAGTDVGGLTQTLVLIALVMIGGGIAFLGVRGQRESARRAGAKQPSSTAVEAPAAVPALWHKSPGRFSRAAPDPSPLAAATVASGQERHRTGPLRAGDPPRPEPAAASGDRSPATPAAAKTAAGSPPDRRLGWVAEIEWRQTDGGSRFVVIARGAGTVELAQSPPLEWPPRGPAGVQAMNDAAEKLADTLLAAGWKPREPGDAWYAKRFAWEPDVDEGADAAPSKPTAAAGVSARSRLRVVVLACVLVALVSIVALQLGSSGGSDTPAVRSTPTATAQAPGAAAARPTPASTPKPKHGFDASVPLVLLLGLIALVVATRHARRLRS